MIKYLFPIAALALCSSVVYAAGETYRLQSDQGQSFTYACADPNISALLAETREDKKPGWSKRDIELQQSGKCIGIPGSPVQVISNGTTTTDSATYPTTEILFSDSTDHLFVLQRNVVPISAAEAQELKSRACGPGIYGETDRLLEDPDGTIKRKRFITTSKCVNGQMRSFTKPIN